MLELASRQDGEIVSLKTIADKHDISMKYLETIVGSLKRAKLLESTRGKDGGYRLCRTAEDYSVGEILRCLEDNLAPVACIKSGSVNCEKAGECITVPMWKELDDITNAYLDTISLKDLLTGDKWKK